MEDATREPSMEDILASIKRIIAEDAPPAGPRGRRGQSAAPPPPASETDDMVERPADPDRVLELTEPVSTAEAGFQHPADQPDVAPEPALAPESEAAPANPVADAAPTTETVAAAPAAGPRRSDEAPAEVSTAETIVAPAVAQASRQSLAALSALLVRPEAGENTLEGLVREMLRPMLKEWLDARLPELVEAMVSREIARITGRDL